MQRQRDQSGAGHAFDRAGDGLNRRGRPSTKCIRRSRSRIDRTATQESVIATPIIMVPANNSPATGTPRVIAKVMTNRVNGQGTVPP